MSGAGRVPASPSSLDLGGDWNVRSLAGKRAFACRVPGTALQCLEESGAFGPGGVPFRENNRRCLEFMRDSYLFSRSFEADEALVRAARAGRAFLEADGLDTIAVVRLNGREIGRSRNMHRRYRFPLGEAVIGGTNSIEIEFADVLGFIEAERERRDLWFAYGDRPEIAFPGFNAVRKSHCSFGWDWGPVAPDAGIWRPIRIVSYDSARIRELRVVQEHSGGESAPRVRLRLSAPVERLGDPGPGRLALSGTLVHPDGKRQTFAFDAEGSADVEVESPRLWWPAGLGGQPLYAVDVRLCSGGEEIDARSLSIGLRTLTVRRERDEWGESFEFVCNGLPFFARGADWIPEDVALARVPPERTARLVADAVAANFNCLRVWGGGVYPSDDFYDLCDRAGIVVWQDLMFACAVYDASNPAFMAEIEAEVRDNLERIRHRASLGLVCGNNEMEIALVDWGLPADPAYKEEYRLMYEERFPAIVREVCPEVFYWPASPSSGGGFDDPNAPDRGDCHFWEVWHGNKDYAEYARHYFRFMSEFGFESFPSMKTIESFTLPGDRNAFSPVMEDHQRCVGGNGKILAYVSRYFRCPEGLESLVHLSQASQAEALRHGIEHWRRNRGRCMGSVFWQYNDNWPVASWSSVDHAGRWKALQYQARRSYAPLLLSAFVPEESVPADPPPGSLSLPGAEGEAARERKRRRDAERLPAPDGNGHYDPRPAVAEIHLSNETRGAVRGRVLWELIDERGAALERGSADAGAGPFSSALAARLDFSSRVNGRWIPRRRFLAFRFEGEGGASWSGDAPALRGILAFVPYKQLELLPARLAARVYADRAGLLRIEVRAEATAFFVEIDHRKLDLVLSDNFFHLAGGETRTIRVERCLEGGKPRTPRSGELRRGLILRSLADA